MAEVFTGSFTQQEPIPEEGIAAALAVLRHGRLHRYNLAPGEAGEVALLEEEFAAAHGRALLPCGGLGRLRDGDGAAGGRRGAGGPGAVERLHAGAGAGGDRERRRGAGLRGRDARPDHRPRRSRGEGGGGAGAASQPHARACLRHGPADGDLRRGGRHGDRGLRAYDGGAWRGVPSGRHGLIGCYSTQTYKHVNSGEGGFLVTDDAEVAARAVLLSGSYMLYDRHRAAPPPEAFEGLRLDMPNISGRMDNLRAAILRPQLRAALRPVRPLDRALPRGGGGPAGHAGPHRDRAAGGGALRRLLDPVPAGGLGGRRTWPWSAAARRGGWS
jgi:hypothetical protein